MPRERKNDEIEFGSDSFLDVVANIVGILIILIVVAGIKAGAAPATAARVADYLRKHAAVATTPAPLKETTAAVPATSPDIEPPPLVIPESPELVRRAESLKADVAGFDADCQTATAQIERTSREERETSQQIDRLRTMLASASGQLGREQHQLSDARSRLERERVGLLQLEVDVQKAEGVKPTVKTLRHKLTPLSREIRGKELHFELLENKVAYLPIEELMERLRPQIIEQRSRLLREGVERGQVGPVNGFRMAYVVRAQRLSAIDEIRQGMSVAIGVSDWKMIPEPDLALETAEAALKEGSDFLRFLRGADGDTTITFWVYPDSFAIYRQLQEFAHQENFTVAARPLPFGVPIAGSPRGSRSSGQ